MEHKGTTQLQTERLVLRPFLVTEGDVCFQNWMSDPDVTRYLTWPAHASAAVSREIVAQWCAQYEDPGFYQWALVPKTLGEPVGSISVVHIDAPTAACEVGYCMGKPWWGQGLMAEALRAVMDYLFDAVGVNRVTARHDTNNPGSGRVMQKAGMRREGILRQAGRNQQGLCDVAVYAMLAADRQA